MSFSNLILVQREPSGKRLFSDKVGGEYLYAKQVLQFQAGSFPEIEMQACPRICWGVVPDPPIDT